MAECDFIEYLRREKGLTEYQISRIQELVDSFVREDKPEASAVEVCPKCGKLHPPCDKEWFCWKRETAVQMYGVWETVHI